MQEEEHVPLIEPEVKKPNKMEAAHKALAKKRAEKAMIRLKKEKKKLLERLGGKKEDDSEKKPEEEKVIHEPAEEKKIEEENIIPLTNDVSMEEEKVIPLEEDVEKPVEKKMSSSEDIVFTPVEKENVKKRSRQSSEEDSEEIKVKKDRKRKPPKKPSSPRKQSKSSSSSSEDVSPPPKKRHKTTSSSPPARTRAQDAADFIATVPGAIRDNVPVVVRDAASNAIPTIAWGAGLVGMVLFKGYLQSKVNGMLNTSYHNDVDQYRNRPGIPQPPLPQPIRNPQPERPTGYPPQPAKPVGGPPYQPPAYATNGYGLYR